MLRATSEMAVAVIVTSVSEAARLRAIWCPASRAVTMSSGWSTMTTMSVATIASRRLSSGRELPVEQREPLLQVESGVHALEAQPELDHRESNLRLQTHDHGVRAPQPRHVGDDLNRPDHIGVHDIDRRDVDDDAVGAETADS